MIITEDAQILLTKVNVSPGDIPQKLKNRRQWVLWRWEEDKDGKPTKVLYDPDTKRKASHSDLETWAYFEDALNTYQEGDKWAGVGFVFSSGDPYTGIDLDKVRDPESGDIEEWAQRILSAFDGAYMDVSPSGRGVHIIVEGRIPRAIKRPQVEAYSQWRFFTVTGVSPW